jgi:hypothetical protein
LIERAVAVLRQELSALKSEVSELRSEATVRSTIEAVSERLAKIETAAERSAPGLRAVG